MEARLLQARLLQRRSSRKWASLRGSGAKRAELAVSPLLLHRPIPELRDDFANLEDGKEAPKKLRSATAFPKLKLLAFWVQVKATSLLFSQLEVKKARHPSCLPSSRYAFFGNLRISSDHRSQVISSRGGCGRRDGEKGARAREKREEEETLNA